MIKLGFPALCMSYWRELWVHCAAPRLTGSSAWLLQDQHLTFSLCTGSQLCSSIIPVCTGHSHGVCGRRGVCQCTGLGWGEKPCPSFCSTAPLVFYIKSKWLRSTSVTLDLTLLIKISPFTVDPVCAVKSEEGIFCHLKFWEKW